jgi:hypothetical protein
MSANVNLLKMLRYLQGLAIAGVWVPALFVAAWLASPPGSGVGAGAGFFFAFGLLFLSFVAAHAVFAASLVGFILLAMRKAQYSALTLISALVGATLAGIVFAHIYFNVDLLAKCVACKLTF